MFYIGMAAVVAVFGSAVMLFPPRLIMTGKTFSAQMFGITIFLIAWTEIALLTEYRASRGRALGITLKPGLAPEKGVRKFSRWEGFDAVVTSTWEVPLDAIAQTAALYWRASGGSGVIADKITHPDLARVVTDLSER